MPPDVRKAFGLPEVRIAGYAQLLGAQPQSPVMIDGSAERFRTSGGGAESLPHDLLRQSLRYRCRFRIL